MTLIIRNAQEQEDYSRGFADALDSVEAGFSGLTATDVKETDAYWIGYEAGQAYGNQISESEAVRTLEPTFDPDSPIPPPGSLL
jgi:hypothetical protein